MGGKGEGVGAGGGGVYSHKYLILKECFEHIRPFTEHCDKKLKNPKLIKRLARSHNITPANVKILPVYNGSVSVACCAYNSHT